MKKLIPLSFISVLLVAIASISHAQNTFTLNPLTSFGPNGDGSIRPGQSIGTSPITGNDVRISAPFVNSTSYGLQPGDPAGGAPSSSTTNIVGTTTNVTIITTNFPNATNGFNMRGLAYDGVSGNLVFVDTHTGSGGSGGISTNNLTITPTSTNSVTTSVNLVFSNAAIYVLAPDSGQIIGALNTNGIIGGAGVGCFAAVGVADDGVIYVANQVNHSATSGFKIYRWTTADINNPDFLNPPTVAFTNVLTPDDRIGQTMAVRGAGANTEIIVGTSGLTAGTTGTNVYLFTTTDGTNFTPHRIFFPGITNTVFNDGIAFGPGNTFWVKQVGQPLLYLTYDPITFAGSVIARYGGSSPSDPLLNLSGIAVDNANHLLAGMEEIGGIAAGGNGKVWLYHIPDPTNHAPAILASRVYVVNFQKTTAPMGYLAFGNGRLFAHASNNGLLVNTVDSVPMSLPGYRWTDYDLSGFPVIRVSDLPATTRAIVGGSAHFEVFAVPDVTNYVWYTNGVPIPGAITYFLNVTNIQTVNSGTVYQVVASNATGSSNSVASTLQVVSPSDFFHPNLLWSFVGGATNYITSSGGANTPNERCLAYNALSNQLIVVKGAVNAVRIYVVNPDTGQFLYLLKTNGVFGGQNIGLCGIGVGDDGAVYAANASTTDSSFRVYRWANTDPNTIPVTIFGTNSSAASSNPVGDLTGSQVFRFGDNLAVRGSGDNTEIILDAQNSTKYLGILRPVPDGTMTNWTQTGYLLQNIQGSYGSQSYGTTIGRSLQFGSGNTFWQKRYNGNAGSPLAEMSYNPGGGIAPLVLGNLSLPLYTNGQVAINLNLNVAAAVNWIGAVGSSLASPDVLDFYDVTDPSQAIPLTANRQNLPGANSGGHLANGNAVAQVIFGENLTTGRHYVFALDGNNGIAAYSLTGGVTPPARFLVQPKNLRILEGSSGSLGVGLDQIATIQWLKGTNPPVDTTIRGNSYSITNATSNAAGDYFVIATNVNGSVTSIVAHVTAGLTNENYSLSQAWAVVPTNSYVSSDGGPNTPNERAFAYDALSNQLIVVKCAPSSTAYTVHVVDAGSGALLHTLDTSAVIHEGPSEVPGSNPIDLAAAAAADDGNIYICSESPNASGGQFGDTTKMFHVFRWTNSAATTPPVLVYEGDPSGQAPGLSRRWGDVMTVRGSGTNTEILLNSYEGDYGAILKPVDASLNAFTNYFFFDSSGGGSIGRSIQFGTNNTLFEKRKGSTLTLSSYDTNVQTSTILAAYDSSSTLGGVAVDTAHNLAIGVDFVGSTTAPLKPDAVALYEISDPNTPMLMKRYDFPVNQVQNVNFIAQTMIVGTRVYALDANNGMMAFYINPPVNSMKLNIVPSGPNLNLSWGNSSAVLQSSSALNPPAWTDLAGPGVTSSLQPASGTNVFYRLIQRL